MAREIKKTPSTSPSKNKLSKTFLRNEEYRKNLPTKILTDEKPSKRKILFCEEQNLDKIYLLRGRLFWRAYQNSALYFRKLVWSKIKLVQKYDPLIHKEIIVVGFPDNSLPEVLERMTTIECQVIPTKSEDIIILQLAKKQPAGQLEDWMNNQDELDIKARASVSPYYAGNDTYKVLYDTFLIVQRITNKLPREAREVYGRKMLETVLEINKNYKKLTKTSCSNEAKLDYLEKLDLAVNDLFLILRMILDIHLVDKQDVINFSYQGKEAIEKIFSWKKKIEKETTASVN